MKFFKSILVLLTGFLLVFVSTPLESSATDFQNGGRTVGGTYVSYNHFITYTDVRCGMNMQSHYHADASRALDKLGIDWNVTSVFNPDLVIDENSLEYKNRSSLRDNSKNRLQIDRSYAKYNMENNSSRWSPTSRAYPCLEWKSNSVSTFSDEVSDEVSDLVTLKDLYYEIKGEKQSLNISLNNHLEKDISGIVERQLADNAEEVSEYTFKNGKEVTLSDFEVVNLKAENSTEPVADGVTFNNPKMDNTTIIEVEVKDTVFRDGNEYKLTGYVVYMDNEYKNLESGIYAELIE
jgi:hypothetical protein